MAIRKSFGGQSLARPGAYSVTRVDLSGGRDLGDNGTLFLLGESDLGAPGDAEGIQSFSSAQLPSLVDKYGSGPIVDAAKAAIQGPSNNAGVAGPDKVLVWKTNSSLQASLNLANGLPATVLVAKDRKWGAPGNLNTIAFAAGSSANQRSITVKKSSSIENLGQNDAIAQLNIQYVGSGSAASLTITGANPNAKVLATVCTGDAGSNLSLNLSNFASVSELSAYIDNLANYTSTLLNTSSGAARKATDLDNVTAADIKTAPISFYRLQREIIQLVNDNSALITLELPSTLSSGIPAIISDTPLAGGAKGASVNSDFSDGLDKSLAEEYEVVVPLVSQDATADILLAQTDSGSTYTAASVLAGIKSHLRLRGNTKNRKEAQGIVGFRASTKAAVNAQAVSLGSELVQLCMQDILIQDISGSLNWKQPHLLAAILAGIRLGSDVGTPLTHKFPNVSDVKHFVNPSTGIASGDFNPDLDYDAAIDSGVTFLEKASGGFRVVVDNTTYGQDASFVFNRGSVMEAAQFAAKTLRKQTESAFVGNKISNGQATSIKSFIRSLLLELNRAQIITGSDSAPQGFKEETFTVVIEGNTARVSVEILPVQGLDFVLIELTLGDIFQSA